MRSQAFIDLEKEAFQEMGMRWTNVTASLKPLDIRDLMGRSCVRHARDLVALPVTQMLFGEVLKQELAASVGPADSVSNLGEEFLSDREGGSAIGSDISQSSSGSYLSAAAQESRCFLEDQLVKILGDRYMRMGDLAIGSMVTAASGNTLKVIGLGKPPHAEQSLVRMKTQSATLTVTASHRIMVQRRSGPQTVMAGALEKGDDVMIANDQAEPLLEVAPFTESVGVIELSFFLDEPIEAFEPLHPAILSKGHGYPKTRRGPRKKSSNAVEHDSIPDTESPWM